MTTPTLDDLRAIERCLRLVRAERDRYRAALVRIADAESGDWGWIAHKALRPESVASEKLEKP